MKGKEKIDKWLEDEAFMSFAQKRTTEIVRYILNNYPYDLKYEELDECFGRDDRYVVPVVDYLVYRLHRAKLKKNSKKRREGIWWVFVQVILLGHDVNLKSATKLFSVLLASKRPLITELADKLRLKYPLLPTISPCPTMRLEAIRSIIPISCRRYPKSV